MRWGRAYFAVQAAAGAVWWIAVFLSPLVRTATLGDLDPVAVATVDIPLFVVASVLAGAGIRSFASIASLWTLVVTVLLAGYATVTGEAGWGVPLMVGASLGSALAWLLIRTGRVPTEWLLVGPLAFRPAGNGRSAAARLVATFAQIAVFWVLFLVVLPLVIRFFEQRWQLSIPLPPQFGAASVALFVLASAFGLWSAVTMSTLGDGTPLPAAMPNRLVIAGPYRFVRNPMAVASIAQGVAVGIFLASWLVVVYAIAGALLWNYGVRPHEEADLEARFGDAFRRYRARVRCWIPRLTPA